MLARALLSALALIMAIAPAGALAAGTGPIGWGSLLHVDLLPYLHRGVQTIQASSFDPTGRDDDGYSGQYSCLRRVPEGCLMAEHKGPGEIDSVWSAGNEVGNVAVSGPLMIELDGHLVLNESWQQLALGHRVAPFVYPFALASNESWGGVSIDVPMPFRHEMRVISEFNPHYFHVVYRTFPSAHGLVTWSAKERVPAAALTEMLHAGTRDPAHEPGAATAAARTFRLLPGQRVLLARLRGAGAITQLRLRFGGYTGDPVDLYRNARLLISFDGARTVDAPVGEFFGSGLGPARVRSLMFAMEPGSNGWMTAWWPMPFASSAQISLENDSAVPIDAGRFNLRWHRAATWRTALGPRGDAAYFHAWGHAAPTEPGAYWRFVNVRGSGTFVGVTLTMMGQNPPGYLEGNELAYVDGEKTPQIQGTGTEDFFGAGWYFFDHLFTLPLTGYTNHSTSDTGCAYGTCKAAYRVMIADAVPFKRSLLYEIEHGTGNVAPGYYSSTAYWYQRG
jgi:D-arabinan exo alpha-(1,3)/(1,5)-arabinofuranosidase (non-reducing end)